MTQVKRHQENIYVTGSDRPVSISAGKVEGFIDPIRDNFIEGWIVNLKDHTERFRITAVYGSQFSFTESDRPRHDVFTKRARKLHCGFRIALADLIDLQEVVNAADEQVFMIRMSIETSRGELFAEVLVSLTRSDYLRGRFRTHLEPVPALIAGWHADFAGQRSYDPTFHLRNADGDVRALAAMVATDVEEAYPSARAWRFASKLDASFLVKKIPVALRVLAGGDVIHEIDVSPIPITFHVDAADACISGWAIDNSNPYVRPQVTVYDGIGNGRSVRACLYRGDVRLRATWSDGFCGFSIPVEDMSGPLAIELVGTSGRVKYAIEGRADLEEKT